jgi:hypothetical protein
MDVLFDGCGKMYLHTGWEKFAHFHDLQAGCVLAFSYLCDVDMSVKVFDDTSCHRYYHGTTMRMTIEHTVCSFFAAKIGTEVSGFFSLGA